MIDVAEKIKRHEGFRSRVYLDTQGVPTGGYGSAFQPGRYLPKIVWEMIFQYDLQTAEKEYDRLGLDLDTARRAVLVDLLYNMGLAKVQDFGKMLTAIRRQDWQKAHDELLDSRYAKQVGQRAGENARMLLTGVCESKD